MNSDKLVEDKYIQINNLTKIDKNIEKPPNNEKTLLNKLKTIKFTDKKMLKIFGLIAGFILIVVLYFSLTADTNSSNSSTTTSVKSTYTTSLEYSNIIEQRLKELIQSIKGAGDVSVMVTLENGLELIYATSQDQRVNTSNSSTSTTSVTTPIIITNSGEDTPLVVKENLPDIKGVVVIASGAKDVSVKLNILYAVKALIDIPSDNIQIFVGK